MKTEELMRMITKMHEDGKTPRTIVMSTVDFESLQLPKWTQQLFGLKLVVAANMASTFVSEHFYESVSIKKVDEYNLKEYQKEIANGHH